MGGRKLIKSIAFWAILAFILSGILVLTDYGVRNSTYSHYAKINLIMQHNVDPRIAVFGSSVGEVGIDTRLLTDSTHTLSYNFSIDGTRFTQYRGLIEELNEYSDSCELVVFAESYFALNKADSLMEVDRYIAHLNNEYVYESLYSIQPELIWKLRYLPFYKFIVAKHSYFKAAFSGLKNAYTERPTDAYLGYTPRHATWQLDTDSLNRLGTKVQVVVDSTVLSSYKQCISRLRTRGRQVLIVIPPVYKDGMDLVQNFTAQKEAFQSLIGHGVYFLDYSTCPISNEKTLFYNNSHLNDSGAAKFSQMLLKDICNILNSPSN